MQPLDLEEIIHIIYSFITPSNGNVIRFAAVSSTFRHVVKNSTDKESCFHCEMIRPKVEIGKREDFSSAAEYKMHCYTKQVKEPLEYRNELENCGEVLKLFTNYSFFHCKLNGEQYVELFESRILKRLEFKISDFIPENIPQNSTLKYLVLREVSFKETDWIILRERLPYLEGLKVFFYHNEILNMKQLKYLYIEDNSINNQIVNQILHTPFENLEKLEIVSYHINEIEKFHLPKLKELGLIHPMSVHWQHSMDDISVRNVLSSIKDSAEKLTIWFGLDQRIFYEISPSYKLKSLTIENPSDEFTNKFTSSTGIKLEHSWWTIRN
ncbi:predicted protein [Naegleria gruberi]|uniref:Predicted protein n=1 Tax=Naegleria gruberi TaxID=5762 RepID=D2VYU8_NAEGR|nr:uncharacterized protein NAEGRDRAFT_74248 [Naegleria gruberi]EFC38020.1 predicted protein [Naegleria gruberi]|eukprot:XP_002670764.1 predicted protein [Naegleria gruberi strain NEG-M]